MAGQQLLKLLSCDEIWNFARYFNLQAAQQMNFVLAFLAW